MTRAGRLRDRNELRERLDRILMTTANNRFEIAANGDAAGPRSEDAGQLVPEGSVRRRIQLLDSGSGEYVEIFLDGEAALETVTPSSLESSHSASRMLLQWRHWLLHHPHTTEWPTLGVAGKGWWLPTIVKEGDRVCPLLAAIATENYSRATGMVWALKLPHAPLSWREHAGRLATALMRSAGRLDGTHYEVLDVASALLMKGARMDDDQLLRESFSEGHRPWPESDVCMTRQEAAPLTCMILRPELRPLGAELFLEALQRHPQRAIEWRDKAFGGASVAHMCVRAGRPEELASLLDIPGMAEQTDDQGETALAYAESIGQMTCAGVLRSHAARQEAAAVLKDLLVDEVDQVDGAAGAQRASRRVP